MRTSIGVRPGATDARSLDRNVNSKILRSQYLFCVVGQPSPNSLRGGNEFSHLEFLGSQETRLTTGRDKKGTVLMVFLRKGGRRSARETMIRMNPSKTRAS